MESLSSIFLPVSLWFQGFGSWLTLPMQAVTFLGNELFYLLIMPALYWCLHPRVGIEIGVLLLLSGSLNTFLKQIFSSPRPFWISTDIKQLASGTSFGFPSGHAQNAASLWGLIAVKSKRFSLQIILVVLIILIGLSRIILGVHFLHDVLAGWLIGAGLLVIYLRLKDPLLSWHEKFSLGKRILIVLCVSLLLITGGAVTVGLQKGNPLPRAWLDAVVTPPDAAGIEGLVSISAIFAGLVSGLIMLSFPTEDLKQGSLIQKAARYLLGLSGVLILYGGLGAVFPEGTSFLSLFLRYLRYTLIGLWIAWGAPQTFLKLNLIPRSKER